MIHPVAENLRFVFPKIARFLINGNHPGIQQRFGNAKSMCTTRRVWYESIILAASRFAGGVTLIERRGPVCGIFSRGPEPWLTNLFSSVCC